jgi:predicted ester cyclase/ketosteroid isomerase-like protein
MDAHALAALYTSDATVEVIGGPTLHGAREVEKYVRDAIEHESQPRVGFGRVWLTANVAIAEMQLAMKAPAGAKTQALGATALSILSFAPDGRIQTEHYYLNEGTFERQASGDPHALAVPAIPTSTEVHVAGDPREANLASFATDYMAANSRGDADVLALIDDKVSWTCMLGVSVQSKAELAGPLKHFRDGFPDGKWTATNAWVVEDYVIVEEKLSGTHKGKFASYEPSGRAMSWRWAEILQVKNGRIARAWSYTNFNDVVPYLTPAVAAK